MNTEWETLNNEAKSLCSQGHYDRAIVVAKKALQVAEQVVEPNHFEVATSLDNLAELYKAQNKYEQAEPLHKASVGDVCVSPRLRST